MTERLLDRRRIEAQCVKANRFSAPFGLEPGNNSDTAAHRQTRADDVGADQKVRGTPVGDKH
ncbi:MAG: hypothetical protein ACREDM_10330 [Methylocella sp.]